MYFFIGEEERRAETEKTKLDKRNYVYSVLLLLLNAYVSKHVTVK